jgi:hypothetical protein
VTRLSDQQAAASACLACCPPPRRAQFVLPREEVQRELQDNPRGPLARGMLDMLLLSQAIEGCGAGHAHAGTGRVRNGKPQAAAGPSDAACGVAGSMAASASLSEAGVPHAGDGSQTDSAAAARRQGESSSPGVHGLGYAAVDSQQSPPRESQPSPVGRQQQASSMAPVSPVSPQATKQRPSGTEVASAARASSRQALGPGVGLGDERGGDAHPCSGSATAEAGNGRFNQPQHSCQPLPEPELRQLEPPKLGNKRQLRHKQNKRARGSAILPSAAMGRAASHRRIASVTFWGRRRLPTAAAASPAPVNTPQARDLGACGTTGKPGLPTSGPSCPTEPVLAAAPRAAVSYKQQQLMLQFAEVAADRAITLTMSRHGLCLSDIVASGAVTLAAAPCQPSHGPPPPQAPPPHSAARNRREAGPPVALLDPPATLELGLSMMRGGRGSSASQPARSRLVRGAHELYGLSFPSPVCRQIPSCSHIVAGRRVQLCTQPHH